MENSVWCNSSFLLSFHIKLYMEVLSFLLLLCVHSYSCYSVSLYTYMYILIIPKLSRTWMLCCVWWWWTVPENGCLESEVDYWNFRGIVNFNVLLFVSVWFQGPLAPPLIMLKCKKAYENFPLIFKKEQFYMLSFRQIF